MHLMILISASLFVAAWVAGFNLPDIQVRIKLALPASTSAVTSGAFDTGKTTALATGVEKYELLITAPTLTTAQLPDAKTMTYKLINSANADLSSPSDLLASLIVQTGAGGVGAALATKRVKVPSDALRYIGLVITPSASGTGDASGATATLQPEF